MLRRRCGALLLIVALMLAATMAPAFAQDTDADGITDGSDNCPWVPNPSQDGTLCAGGQLAGWSFDEPDGQWIYDSSSDSALTGVLGDSTANEKADPTRIRPGATGSESDGALDLDGRFDRARAPGSSLQPPVFSLGASVRSIPGDVNPYDHIVSKGLLLECGAVALKGVSYSLHTVAGRETRFSITAGGQVVSSAGIPSDLIWNGEWHRIVGTFDGNAVRILLDGEPIGEPVSSSSSSVVYDGSDIIFGNVAKEGCSKGVDTAFGGDLDDVGVWNCVLTEHDMDCDGINDSTGSSGGGGEEPPSDRDADGVPDTSDNCPDTPNPGQEDADGDQTGDACDQAEPPSDRDFDGVPDSSDNCPDAPNPNQEDADGDQIGDVCDQAEPPSDRDSDGVPDASDNCPDTPNPDQEDADGDQIGDACDQTQPPADSDFDGVPDTSDNCPDTFNPDQEDADGDQLGDACDQPSDRDGDSFPDDSDNCPDAFNPDQTDGDGDGAGDACDQPDPPSDSDGDGVPNDSDNCPETFNPDQTDSDGDGAGDACDQTEPPTDSDSDGVPDVSDNCPNVANSDQLDSDGDGVGDACDQDADPQPSDFHTAGAVELLNIRVDGLATPGLPLRRGVWTMGNSGREAGLQQGTTRLDVMFGSSQEDLSDGHKTVVSQGNLAVAEVTLAGVPIRVEGVHIFTKASTRKNPEGLPSTEAVSTVKKLIVGDQVFTPGAGQQSFESNGITILVNEMFTTSSRGGALAIASAVHAYTISGAEVRIGWAYSQIETEESQASSLFQRAN